MADFDVKKPADVKVTAEMAFGLDFFDTNTKEEGDKLDELTSHFSKLGMDDLSEKQDLYNEAFVDHDVCVGKALSRQERDKTGLRKHTLVYGEIRFDSFALALQKVKHIYGVPGARPETPAEGIMQQPGGIFYDIGSGTGKPTVAAALVHPFSKAYGIELLSTLHQASLTIKEKWEAEIQKKARRDTELCFVCGDITSFEDHDWSDGDVLFANSTCFDEQLMLAVAQKAAYLKKGAIFITLTKRIPGQDFTVLESEVHQMSWGGATVYIQQKITDRKAEDPEALEDDEQNGEVAAPEGDGDASSYA